MGTTDQLLSQSNEDLKYWNVKMVDNIIDAEALLQQASDVAQQKTRADEAQRYLMMANIHAQLAVASATRQLVLLKSREMYQMALDRE